ncbi:S-adenosyl-L-methionine-dependent methyltransferase [Cyathus striatus]|nr:S-adenosyl-L-methionine-dependent methyltransferase [Cyathus striatus]
MSDTDTDSSFQQTTKKPDHLTRPRHSYVGAAYTLPADDVESKRLITQHHLLKRVFEGNLLAPVILEGDDKVLDSCTGTAIWLLELAKEVPASVLLHGFDIETRQFPVTNSLPGNLELSKHSVLSLPPKWTDRFTIVHQRLVVDGLRCTEWPQALKELHRVTKPGGWLELCETPDWSAGPINEKWKELLRDVYNDLGLVLDGGKDIECIMRNTGFVDLQVVERTVPLGTWGGKDGKMQSDNLMEVWRGMGRVVLEASKNGVRTEQELNGWLRELEKEYKEFQGTISWVICFGRKAS